MSITHMKVLANLRTCLLWIGMEFVTPFRTWWGPFAYKREVLAACGLILVVLVVVGHYAGLFDLGLGAPFGWPEFEQAVNAFFALLGLLWATYSVADRAQLLARKKHAFARKQA